MKLLADKIIPEWSEVQAAFIGYASTVEKPSSIQPIKKSILIVGRSGKFVPVMDSRRIMWVAKMAIHSSFIKKGRFKGRT